MRIPSLVSALPAAWLLACSGLAQAAPADIQGLTVVESGGRTRALIEVPASTQYSMFKLANPARLVIDLHDSRLGNHFRTPGPDGVIANVRTGQPSPGDVRVVLELSAAVRPRSYFHEVDGRSELIVELLTAADTAKSGPSKPDPVVAVLTPQAAPAPKPDPLVGVLGSQPAFAPQPDLLAAAPGTDVPREAAGRAAERTRFGKAAPAKSMRDANPRVAPPISSVVITPDPGPMRAASADAGPFDADDTASMPQPVRRAGARTLRDVLGGGQRKLVIAIDAGHGGQDTGARGFSGSLEKNVTLATARELARQVNAEPGMQAVLIRDGDYFVPLAERYHKAREARADLFISVHADADPTHTATGSSVWVLSQRGVTSQAARWLADRENAADLIGGVSLSDKDGTLASVLLDLSQSATMKASGDAAERVHQALRDIGRTHKSHPENANFVVLRSPDVPSMLVETAFITNAGEEQHLNDPDYRSRLARAVLGGVRGYFIDNPLPGTQFAALHERGQRGTRSARMLAAAADTHPAADQAPGDEATDVPLPASDLQPAPMQIALADPVEQIHVVQRGERLQDIADRFGVSLMQLRALNDLAGNRVKPGLQLRIPVRAGAQ